MIKKLLLAILFLAIASTAGAITVIYPAGDTINVLTNPDIGLCTFNRTNSPVDLTKYPKCTTAYYRFFWEQLEPQDGVYNWSAFDAILTSAATDGQRVGLRIMCGADSGQHVPYWLIDLGAQGQWIGSAWWPYYDDPVFLQYAERLTRAIGERYGTDQRLSFVDIGILGKYGEGHISGATGNTTYAYHWPPSFEAWKNLNRWHCEAFPNTTKISVIADESARTGQNRDAVARGCGWRYDSAGSQWHQNIMYPQSLDAETCGDVWQIVPVYAETYGDISSLYASGGIDAVKSSYDYALGKHVSLFNAKSVAIPAACWEETNKFLRKCGYRISCHQVNLSHTTVKVGEKLIIKSYWKNTGSAPVYRNHKIVWRLCGNEQASKRRISNWQQSLVEISIDGFVIPQIASGQYWLDVALKDERDGNLLNLAMGNKQPDGWYRITQLEVIQ
jgi:hypothetical protein